MMPGGCESCGNSGYLGRQVIAESFLMDESFHEQIIKDVNIAALERLAKQHGMRPMLDDGLGKAAAGISNVQEVLRVVR